jgi:hypothetical protein
MTTVAKCSCGKSYNLEGWLNLKYVGIQDIGDGDALELRNCTCRSTIAVQLVRGTEAAKTA